MACIYQPKGKALEYSELAANLYRGCSHGCVYCYAPSATYTDRQRFSDPAYISPRKNIIPALEADASKMKGDSRPVLFSFTSDAYQASEKTLCLMRHALIVMRSNGLTPQILTKAGAWAVKRDIDILKGCNAIWAASLTSDDDAESLQWEPGAALPADRVEALRFAKQNGLRTWVSFEPVFNPDAVLRLIDTTHSFVDLYKVGKMNYHPIAQQINWSKFLVDVESRLDMYSCKRYIKKDLLSYRLRTAA